MSLSGNLEDVSVADALQFIHLGGRTGTLTLSQGEATAEIGFHQGRIVNAWGPGSKRLGELLLDAGVIDQPTLAAAGCKRATSAAGRKATSRRKARGAGLLHRGDPLKVPLRSPTPTHR